MTADKYCLERVYLKGGSAALDAGYGRLDAEKADKAERSPLAELFNDNDFRPIVWRKEIYSQRVNA